ncbi:MAG: Glutamyl-tRNA synthetase @ Glutamyl-tRNA(Gln) synthetase, partial [uncultured Blastococcus sp.]
ELRHASACRPDGARADPLLPVAHGHRARRADADGAVQLGARPAHRRHVRLPHRGHRRRPRLRGVLPAPARLPALAGPRLGRGPGGRRSARSLPAVGARGGLRRRRGQAARRRARLRVLLHQRGGRRPPPRRRPGPEARLRQPRPVPHRRAASGVPPRGAHAGAPAADARRGPRLDRSGARRRALRRGRGARLRAGARQRRSAVPLRQSRRRRPDGDHRRAARRGPAALHPAPAGAVRGTGRDRDRLRRPALRPPAAGHRRGHQEALQARPAVQPRRLPRPRFPARGLRELPGAARVVDRRGPRHLRDGRAGRGLRRHPGQRQPGPLRPQEGRGHQRHPPACPAGGGVHREGDAVPRRSRTGQRAPHARAAARAGRDRTDGPGTDDRPLRGRGTAALPVRRGRRDRAGGGGQAAVGRRRRRGARRRHRGTGGARRLVDPGDRGGPQERPGRRSGPQAPAGLRPCARGAQRPHRVPTALRVDRDPGARAHAGPAGRRPSRHRM